MERTLAAVIRATQSPSLSHTVCTLREPGPLADQLPAEVAVIPLNCRRSDRWAAVKLASVIRRIRPDILHARNFNTWCDAVLARRIAGHEINRTVLGFHGLEHDGGFTSVQRRRARWLRLRRFPFTAVSYAGKQQLVDELGAPSCRVDVLPNGVSIERFRPPTADQRCAARAAYGVRPDETVIAMVGALAPVKDHRMALDAVASSAPRLGGVCILLAGDGPLRGPLENRAETLPESVRTRFLGSVEDVAGVLHAADLFVHPSRYEQSSNAVLEAMACGLPILLTAVGDAGCVANAGRCARLVAPCDSDSLAAALVRMIHDPAERQRLGAAARQRAESCHGFSAAVERYQAFYRSIGSAATQPEFNECAALPASCPTAR